jgi:hypothetical protein
MMTWDERVEAVAAHTRGLTDRQAAFLVTVMLHAGVCVLRQYSTFAGMPHGRKVIDFFRLLVDRGYATAHSCRHNRARIFHIQYKPLYAAIGEPDNRHRKPTPLPRAVERLMVLDAVLADPTRTWLATEQDKLAHFMLTHRIPRHDLPSLIFRSQDTETVRSFPDKLPIGIGQYGEAYTFLYLVTRPGPVDFRAFLERHAELLRALREWTIRLLIPSHYARATRMYREAFREHFGMPLRPVNLTTCVGTFTPVGRAHPVPTNASIRRRAPSARHALACCTERGSSVATPCSMRPSRPCWRTRLNAARVSWSARSSHVSTCTSFPWWAPRDRAQPRTRRWTRPWTDSSAFASQRGPASVVRQIRARYPRRRQDCQRSQQVTRND